MSPGLVVGNSATRAHNTVVAFLDAATWLAQIVMFVVLGLLSWPDRLPGAVLPALAVAATLMFIARPGGGVSVPCAVPLQTGAKRRSCPGSACAARSAFSSPRFRCWSECRTRTLYFDIGFVVVLVSLLVQGWTIAPAARRLRVSFPRSDPLPRRVELDLPGQLEQEIVGYPLGPNSPYLRRGAAAVLGAADAGGARRAHPQPARGGSACAQGDYVYLLAPPEQAQALDRFFVDMPPPAVPDPRLLGDFFVSGDQTLGELAEIYGLSIAPESAGISLADHIAEETKRRPRQGDIVPLGPIALVAQRVTDGRVTSVGLRLAEDDEKPATGLARLKNVARDVWKRFG